MIGAMPPALRQSLLADAPPELRRRIEMASGPQQMVARDLSEGKLLRAVYSDRQLEEVLTDFWFNHFNVYLDKGADRYLVTEYERDVIRPHVLGKFEDLLKATAKSPAMMFYLDNWQSVGPNAPPARGKKGARGLNENYGRELLELHTLGRGRRLHAGRRHRGGALLHRLDDSAAAARRRVCVQPAGAR